ncbi:hypothetical protein BU23DRAFT_628750, partial [Bimuria novae-zelandiae CBS 107.79]
AVVTKYIKVLRPLKLVIKRLKSYSKSVKSANDVNSPLKSSYYSAIAKIIPIFKYILLYYK